MNEHDKGYPQGTTTTDRLPPGLHEAAAKRAGSDMAIVKAMHESIMRDAMENMKFLIDQKDTQEKAEWNAADLHRQACEKVEELSRQFRAAEEAQMHAFSVQEQAEEATEATKDEIIRVAIKMSQYQAKLDSMDIRQPDLGRVRCVFRHRPARMELVHECLSVEKEMWIHDTEVVSQLDSSWVTSML